MSEIIKKSVNFLKNNQFFTNTGEEITFQLTQINPEFDSYNLRSSGKKSYIIEAMINDEQAGYLIITNISNNFTKKYLPNFFDWCVDSFGNNKLKDKWKNKKDNQPMENPNELILFFSSLLNEKLYCFEDLIEKKLEDNSLFLKYNYFVKYYIDHPNVEIVYVHSDEDLVFKDFSEFPFLHQKRKTLINYRGKLVSQSLYQVAAMWMEQLNLHIYESNTQTEDGKKLWQKLHNYPAFEMLIENNMNSIINKPRKFIQLRK